MEGAALRELPLGTHCRLERTRGRQDARQSTSVGPFDPGESLAVERGLTRPPHVITLRDHD